MNRINRLEKKIEFRGGLFTCTFDWAEKDEYNRHSKEGYYLVMYEGDDPASTRMTEEEDWPLDKFQQHAEEEANYVPTDY